MIARLSPFKNNRGLTLTEMMIAAALMGIGIIVAAGAFRGIHRAIQYSKTRTLAANIAQEKMQILTQKSYYEVLVTTAPAYLVLTSTTIAYDNTDFVPETLTEGGSGYTRYTNIQVVQENSTTGLIQVLAPLTPDTGMRQITITVVWNTDSGQKFLTIQSVLNNPNTVMASTWLNGTVTDITTHGAISGALVDAAENVGWRDTTTNTGAFKINLVPGTFNFQASAPGYYSAIQMCNVVFNGSSSCSFTLQAIATGTVQGVAWINTHPVITQVVASTGAANSIEYVELYNPTTSAILMGSNGSVNNPNIWPILWDSSNNGLARHLYYMTGGNSMIPAYGYYLISNTGNSDPSTTCAPFAVMGILKTPDACWLHVISPNLAIECGTTPCPTGGNPWPGSGDAGGVSLGNAASVSGTAVNMGSWPATRIDSIGWAQTGAGHPAPSNAVEGTGIQAIFSGGIGLPAGEQFVRKMDTGTISGAFGRAYDANMNSLDFSEVGGIIVAPNNSATTVAPLAGTPAVGAIVSVSDSVSAPAVATLTGFPSYARYSVPGVATGTWTVLIDSNTSAAEIDTVTVVAANSIVSIPNNSTTPTWPVAGDAEITLSTSNLTGIIDGHVTDDLNTPLSGITVTAGTFSTATGLSGGYSLRVTSGTYVVTANPNNANSTYASATQPGVIINIGDVTQDIPFVLPKTGKIQGWISRDGVNPLPGVDVVAMDSFGSAHDTEASGNNGIFTLINLTTGVYTVQPALDPKETSTPISSTITVNAGTTVWVGTFTITGAMGQVQGNVKSQGSFIKSGVLIVISTQAISVPLPTLSSNTLTSAAFYSDSSNESGTYSVDVRGSTTSVYNVAAFYMHLNNQTPVISSATCTSVTVTAGQATTQASKACLAFSW